MEKFIEFLNEKIFGLMVLAFIFVVIVFGFWGLDCTLKGKKYDTILFVIYVILLFVLFVLVYYTIHTK